MKVKRYVVDDVPEAVQLIRSELGSDAVILNTKEIRTGGFLGMFRKKRVEVIAAVDDTSRRPPARIPQPVRRPAAPVRNSEAEQKEPIVAARSPLPSEKVRQLYANSTSEAPPKPDTAKTEEAQQPTREQAPAPASAQAAGLLREKDEAAALLEELRSMKEMMHRLTKQQTFSSMPESVFKWSRRLAEQGVDPIHVEHFAEEVKKRLEAESRGPSDSAAYEAAAEVLRSWLVPFTGSGIGEDTRIVHFVGPTGVGKTTTIAKLAAEQSLNHRRNVGLITADTYRISAVDQLRTYADILNVPLEVVFSPGELTRAYHKLADRDLLLMDTAGRNYRNELFVSEVNSLLAPGEQAETFLVLSMTHKYTDMKAVVAQFAKYGVRRLLLTKVDETATYGSIVNLVREFGFPISYVTCGQTVPDDIRVFNPDEWVIKLLGEPKHE